MTELYDGLMTTRAMRRFTDEPVTDEEVERILAAAVQAPSGGNIQPYQFLVVTDAERRASIGAIYLRAYDRYEPAVLALFPPIEDRGAAPSRAQLGDVAAPRRDDRLGAGDGPRARAADLDDGARRRRRHGRRPVLASVYPAVQNLVLAARSLGIGTCLTTVYRIHEAEVRAVCDIPDRYEVVALLPLGRPTGRWGVAPRRPAPVAHELEHLRQQAPLSFPGRFHGDGRDQVPGTASTARSGGGPSCRPSPCG